ncbi:MAG: hypothetical protein HY835_06965 [Anaerolineae bacterium]|nr:hypothetical protein [Anaerolineae bacterium]
MTVSSEERMKILKMIQEGKLTAQEGMELLDTLDARPEKSGPAQPPTPPLIPPLPIRESRWFRVVVTDTTTGKTRVNVRLPISLVSAGMKMGAKFSPQVEGLDSEKLMELLRSGETGRVLDVVNKEDTERVEVFIE